ncbi:flagellar basal body rod protein FlgC [Aquibacillus halophilus]|uniref:Flagellar basal-body rod protein FlgC n=1 Tax=Aquibacillus halophilus TaxID=930132 RepID=A0A6A8D9H8_9BACI|nr:flagellar basal body rod protein FlgC [Aquibacillus halophilus]MRH42254.1 flagellar basal body rod protein FlgC [Aquibacillus halophilus]
MSIFHSINTSASALTSQRLRMDTISSNIANAETTRATINENGEYEPYRRKMVVFEQNEQRFSSFLRRASSGVHSSGSGVRVSEIVEDDEPFKLVFNPNHPDANEEGYVQLPNVDPLKEMVDLMSTTRSYEANVTSLNATKSMLMKALEIGK